MLQHANTLTFVEDAHVRAEAALRSAQEVELRSTTTALRHMEAYCAGVSSNTNLPHDRRITPQDVRELSKTRQLRASMPTRHESAINVLRGEQGRRLAARLKRMDEEIAGMEGRLEEEMKSEGLKGEEEMRGWEEEVARLGRGMQRRWALEVGVWCRRLEEETGVRFEGTLPVVPWGGDEENWRKEDNGAWGAGNDAAETAYRWAVDSDAAGGAARASPKVDGRGIGVDFDREFEVRVHNVVA